MPVCKRWTKKSTYNRKEHGKVASVLVRALEACCAPFGLRGDDHTAQLSELQFDSLIENDGEDSVSVYTVQVEQLLEG